MAKTKDPKKVAQAKAQPKKGGKFASAETGPVYDPDAKIEKIDRGIITSYKNEVTQENPKYVTNLYELAVKKYFDTINLKTHKTKRKNIDAGQVIYDNLFQYVKDEVWALNTQTRRGERRIEQMVQEDIGLSRDSLGMLFKQGSVTLKDYEDNISRPTADRLGKILDANSERGLKTHLLNDGVRNHLVKEARKLGIKKIKPESIMTIEDLRAIVKAIVQADTIATGLQEGLLNKLYNPN